VPRKKKTQVAVELDSPGRLAFISRHPREFVSVVMASFATVAILVNALFLQKGPHPAPMFVARSPLTHWITRSDNGTQSRSQLISGIQRELSNRGFYDGAADGIWGTKTDSAARDFAQASRIKIAPEASKDFLDAVVESSAKSAASASIRANDPIAALISPSKRVVGIQRALTDFGYGQLKPTGIFDSETQAAIEKFERSRRLPLTGKISDRVVRELAAVTGRPLE
jgi:peptidoglycan hydrolase-like protein with peptidoglycan-binding domain